MNPFPAKAVEKILKKSKKILNIECNFSGQVDAASLPSTRALKLKIIFINMTAALCFPRRSNCGY
jgi:pyruvate/2-oxoacid:ferredoxin oxidoreductase alpha subunit